MNRLNPFESMLSIVYRYQLMNPTHHANYSSSSSLQCQCAPRGVTLALSRTLTGYAVDRTGPSKDLTVRGGRISGEMNADTTVSDRSGSMAARAAAHSSASFRKTVSRPRLEFYLYLHQSPAGLLRNRCTTACLCL
jgi:hypothetical protein